MSFTPSQPLLPLTPYSSSTFPPSTSDRLMQLQQMQQMQSTPFFPFPSTPRSTFCQHHQSVYAQPTFFSLFGREVTESSSSKPPEIENQIELCEAKIQTYQIQKEMCKKSIHSLNQDKKKINAHCKTSSDLNKTMLKTFSKALADPDYANLLLNNPTAERKLCQAKENSVLLLQKIYGQLQGIKITIKNYKERLQNIENLIKDENSKLALLQKKKKEASQTPLPKDAITLEEESSPSSSSSSTDDDEWSSFLITTSKSTSSSSSNLSRSSSKRLRPIDLPGEGPSQNSPQKRKKPNPFEESEHSLKPLWE